MNKIVDYGIPSLGLIAASLIVLTENAEFNDFPAPGLIVLSYILCMAFFAYYVYKLEWKKALPFLFAIFFQATAIRAADYPSFTQAHVLTLIFIAWAAYTQRNFANKLLLTFYLITAASSLAIIYVVQK